MNFIENIDYFVGMHTNSFMNYTNHFFNNFLSFLTSLGNIGFIFILVTLILVIIKRTRKRGLELYLALGIVSVFTLFLKYVVKRDRPFINEESIYFKWWVDAGSLYVAGYSFPSGHTSASVTLGVTLFLTGNYKKSWVYLLIPILFGYSRIYFMVHYFSDVFVGCVIGIIASLLSLSFFKFILYRINLFKSIYASNKVYDLF